MRRALIFTTLLLATSAFATTYKWVDKDGVVHFSDRPVPGAVVVDVHSAQTFPAQRPQSSPGAGNEEDSGDDQQQQQAYTKLDVWKPENGQTFRASENQVDVRLRLEPELQQGDSIWIYLDGKRVDGLPSSGEAFTLKEVWRGSHTLNAIVADRGGKPLIRSQTITFFMQQTSVLAPNRPAVAPRN